MFRPAIVVVYSMSVVVVVYTDGVECVFPTNNWPIK